MTDLIERLENRRAELTEIAAYQDGYISSFCKALRSELLEAISELKAREWVKIENIPEEWKDGRPLDVLTLNDDRQAGNKDYVRRMDITWQSDVNYWSCGFYYEVTHAMLPPPIPGE